VTYRIELLDKDSWVALKNYTGLSKLKAEFLMALCIKMNKPETKLRVVPHD
jgi:hypothetical protein